MLARLMERLEPALGANTAAGLCSALFEAVAGEGASYFQGRVYRRPGARLTAQNHFAAGGRVHMVAPRDWLTSAAGRYVCFENNPLLTPIRENRTRYAFSDFAPRRDSRLGPYWDALGEARIHEALCATSYGQGNRIASIHLGFQRTAFTEAEKMSIQLAALAATERLLVIADAPGDEEGPALTPREIDALAYVADGKTDWEISVIFGVSEATARFHVDNGRRKLGAVNRTQAVARMVARRMI